MFSAQVINTKAHILGPNLKLTIYQHVSFERSQRQMRDCYMTSFNWSLKINFEFKSKNLVKSATLVICHLPHKHISFNLNKREIYIHVCDMRNVCGRWACNQRRITYFKIVWMCFCESVFFPPAQWRRSFLALYFKSTSMIKLVFGEKLKNKYKGILKNWN